MPKIIKNNISYTGTEDNKVKQNETSIDAEYEVLLSGTADNTTRAEEARKSEALTFNPETGALTIKNEDAASALTVFGPYTSLRPAFTITPDDEGGASVHLFKSDMPAVFITAHNHTADPNDSEDEDRIGGEISLNGTSSFSTINLDGQTSTITVSNPSNAIPIITLNGANGGITATSLNGVNIGNSPKFTDTTYTSKAATSGGTDVSLCTTGEKYNWNRTNNVLPGYKVRIVSFTLGSVDVKTAFGNLYRSANLTRSITSASIGGITTITGLFPTCYRSDGTISTQINIQSITKSSTTFTVNYVLIRPTSSSVTNLNIHFLIIGT